MSRVQLALRVSDLEGSIAFYSSLFGVEPAKRRRGYANFAVTEPALKLVLIEGEPDRPTVMDHLGVEVETTDEVNDATARLSELGCSPRSRTTPPAATRSRTRCGSTVPGPSRGRCTPSRPTPPTRPASIPSARTPPGSASAARRARRTASSRPAADRVTPVALHRRHLDRTALPGRANSRDRARSGLR